MTDRYCRACGSPLSEHADVCPDCGVAPDVDDVGGETAYCRACGEEIKAAAEICPHCGVRQRPRPSSGATSDLESLFYENRGLVAAVASFFFPGLGQILNGQVLKGALLFVVFTASAFAILVGIGLVTTPLLLVYAVYDAYTVGRDLEAQP